MIRLMYSIPRRSFLLLAPLCLTASGCASRGMPTIPVGEWRGHGTFTYERWGEPENTASHHRDYATCLCIKKSTVDGQPAFEIEIISDRGALPELGDRTHMRLALVEVSRPSNSAVLYRLAGPLYDPKPNDQPTFESDSPPVAASCMKIDGVAVLQIAYEEGFVDTFRFRARGLSKAGSLTLEDGSVHWVESLLQTKPVDLLFGNQPFNHLAGG